MTRAEDVIEVIDALSAAGVPVWLFGGWAVEAQIPEARRCHCDIDLVVRADDLDRARELIEGIGYTDARDTNDPCEHLRFGRLRECTEVQVSSSRIGQTYWWLSVTGGASARDLWLPCPLDGFPVEEKGELLRHPVRCAAPEVLLQSNLSWQGNRQTDSMDVAHLRRVLPQDQVKRAERNCEPLPRSCCDADREAIAGDVPSKASGRKTGPHDATFP